MGGYWQLVFVCCLLVQGLSAEDSVKDNSTPAVNNNSTSVAHDNSTSAANDNSTSAANDNSTSVVNQDEELEKNIGQRMASLREMEQDEIRLFADLALQNFNAQEESLFTTLGDATVMIKKAVGSILSLRMTVEKTNCTKKDLNPHHRFGYRHSFHFENEEPPKYCGPLDGHDKEQLDCKFDIFKDERSYREAAMNHDCKPVKVVDRNMVID